MNDLVNDLVNGFLDSIERIKEFIEEQWQMNRPLVLAVAALIVLLFLGLILLIAWPKGPSEGPVQIPANVDFFIEYPSEPEFADEYILEKKETKIEDSFVTDWFSPVDESLLEELGQATHSITESILEAVP